MPVVKRHIEPVHVFRGAIPANAVDDLEAVCVNGIAGLLQQLGNLARHADSIFHEVRSGGGKNEKEKREEGEEEQIQKKKSEKKKI